MEKEKKLLQEQMTYKSRFARFIENTNKIGIANLTFDILNARMELLEKYWNQALVGHKKLNLHMLALADEEYFSSDMFSDYENDYVVAKAYLSGKLGQCIENVQRLQQNAAPPNAMELRSISASIPKLERPKFSGKQEEWETFKEAFTAMFKDDPNLMPNLKLQHLISCLKGDAARRIANFKVTGANFDVAWQALCRRYDNKRLRLSTHMNMLIKAPPMSKKSVPEISRLLDITDQCIRALKALSRPVEDWDDWLIQLIVMKLDSSIREDWEKSLEGSNDFPTYYQLVSFLENRIQSIETSKSNESSSSVSKTKSSQQSRHIAAHLTSDDANSTAEEKRKPSSPSCVLCKGDHYINYCPKFTHDDVAARRDIAKRNQLCFNCLRKKHTSSNCSSKYRCKTCGSKHHTLLHDEDDEGQETSNSTTACLSSESITKVRANTIIAQQSTLLGTAIIQLTNKTGERIEARALIDPCSERCFITERVAQLLSLPKMPFRLTVSGVGALPTATSKHTVHVSVQSNIDSNFTLSISAAVLTRLTQQLPRQSLKRASWPHLQGLTLADPDYATSKSVDCILGADAYAAIMMEGLRTGPPGTPLAQNTRLGWILTGPVDSNPQAGNAVSFTTLTDAQESLSDQLRRFWEVEETMPARAQLTADEQDCEEQFKHGHQRDESGRYVVRLPFREQPLLTGSRQIATRRLMQTEHRLQRNHKLRETYCKFMYEYEALNHMKRLGNEQSSRTDTNYIPHHAVLRSGSDKIRVVFDAAQVCGEKSLNYFLHPGPKLQADIMTVLSRWRIFRYVFSADIVKMFRQIRVHPDDIKWQRIVWRNAPTEALADYELLTVTYGTACAPYLANRVLKQLAIDEGDRFPIGAKIIRENTYVDDALAGGHTEAEALQAQRQLIDMLSSAGMHLDKWSANFELIIPSDNESPSERRFAMPDNVSILGLRWIPHEDAFTYHVQPTTATAMITKRIILSCVAKLYDPMGWIAPLIVRAKVMLQQLWIAGKDWDTPVNDDVAASWKMYCDELPQLQSLRIPRWLGTNMHCGIILHGFSDSSEKAYAATVYAVVRNGTKTFSTLLAAKSKVAPIKTISLPKLELCGAVLLARLTSRVIDELKLQKVPTHCWSDSQVVLAWLNEHPSRWKTFVANRTSEILNALPEATWAHVKSKENPADLATRGLSPSQLVESELWWKGPSWLLQDTHTAPPDLQFVTTIEQKQRSTCAMFAGSHDQEDILSRFSSWNRMLRVMSYVRRWTSIRNRAVNAVPDSLILAAEEIHATKTAIIQAVQQEAFSVEITRLQNKDEAMRGSSLRKLKPFLDDEGTLRVGGRLHFSTLPFNEKHPIIMPGKNRVTALLIQHAHVETMHGGPQLTQSHLQRAFWITSARVHIKAVLQKCIRCIRFQGKPLHQQMAPLPAVRVTPSRAFSRSGVDYAGPFPVRTTKGRGHKSTKGYVAVFTCMVTKAVHLEVSSDYSSKTFLAALDRFFSRRGLAHTIYSDNGTTFKGADTELKKMFTEASQFSEEVAASIAARRIQWRYNPPKAPHFGGLWEAAVKGFKHHLKRVVGNSTLTFEEFSTLAARIEACLNSRPLSPLSSDPTDLVALTPGHFLTGDSLLAPPEAPCDEHLTGRDRWQALMQMRNHFWHRWRKEVLRELQSRSKWMEASASPHVGDLVLLTDDQQPPLHWPLARITELHSGPDGLVRVLTLRTPHSTLKRPVHRVILLPINEAANIAYAHHTSVAMAGGNED